MDPSVEPINHISKPQYIKVCITPREVAPMETSIPMSLVLSVTIMDVVAYTLKVAIRMKNVRITPRMVRSF